MTETVKVIRCKDCEYWIPDGEGVKVCTGAMAYANTAGDWYCASAKKKKVGQPTEKNKGGQSQ